MCEKNFEMYTIDGDLVWLKGLDNPVLVWDSRKVIAASINHQSKHGWMDFCMRGAFRSCLDGNVLCMCTISGILSAHMQEQKLIVP